MVRGFLGILLVSYLAVTYAAIEFYDFPSVQQEKAYQELIKELRCVVCAGQNLAESNAPVALELRKEIVEQLGRGASKESIINILTERYGEMILYKPPVQKNTLILWGLPFLLLAFVVALGLKFIRDSQVDNL